MRQYIDYIEKDEWGVTNVPLPVLLILCDSSAVERRIVKQALRVLSNSDEDFKILTTTLNATKTTQLSAIWTSVDEHDGLVTLAH